MLFEKSEPKLLRIVKKNPENITKNVNITLETSGSLSYCQKRSNLGVAAEQDQSVENVSFNLQAKNLKLYQKINSTKVISQGFCLFFEKNLSVLLSKILTKLNS